MKRAVIGSVSALLFSAALAAQATTQQPPPQPPQQPPAAAQQAAPKAQEITLVGCVAQGTSASVFLFENAVDPAKKDDKARVLRIVGSGENMDFTPHLNHKVQIVGTLDTRTPPPPPPVAGAKTEEKDLPVLTVKSVTHIATTCSTAGQ